MITIILLCMSICITDSISNHKIITGDNIFNTVSKIHTYIYIDG